MKMAKVERSNIFEIRKFHHNAYFTVASNKFITSSSTNVINKTYPLNHPYSIYNPNVWDTLGPTKLANFQTDWKFGHNKTCWWDPDQENVVCEFLEASSMHGLKYVSQSKLHLLERVFWSVSFVACIVAAGFMISEIWNRYYLNPVIVTFNPSEQDIDAISFPAVTICNMNPFKRSKVKHFMYVLYLMKTLFNFGLSAVLKKIDERIREKYKTSLDKKERNYALEALRIINSICASRPSLLKSLNLAPHRGDVLIPEAKESPSLISEQNLTEFLLQHTQPCNELLRLCAWEHEGKNCEELFKPVLTDYGKCCTFNMLPQELMEYASNTSSTFVHTEDQLGAPSWNKLEVEEWTKWDYEDGYILYPDLKYPYRQHRVGMLDGLSLVVDPDIQNSFCPSSDSEGLKVLFHVPLDAPRVADLGSIIGLDRETFVEVHPDLTVADEDIESYKYKQRKCYFGKEFRLSSYRPYTRSNCFEECFSEILLRNCGCVLYYTPRNVSINVCSSADKLCIKQVEEITYATLQTKDIKWAEENFAHQEWMSHKISIVHVFMGTDTTVPKLRQKLYQTVDLIANTGGLLGLSIGFSVLSLVEILYFATMRICCKRLRKSTKYGASLSPESDSDTRE